MNRIRLPVVATCHWQWHHGSGLGLFSLSQASGRLHLTVVRFPHAWLFSGVPPLPPKTLMCPNGFRVRYIGLGL